MRKWILFAFVITNIGFLAADDKTEVKNTVSLHWKYQNDKNWK